VCAPRFQAGKFDFSLRIPNPDSRGFRGRPVFTVQNPEPFRASHTCLNCSRAAWEPEASRNKCQRRPIYKPTPVGEGRSFPAFLRCNWKKTARECVCVKQKMYLRMSGMGRIFSGSNSRTGTVVERPRSNRVVHLDNGYTEQVNKRTRKQRSSSHTCF
jgi:hypothetical protein